MELVIGSIKVLKNQPMEKARKNTGRRQFKQIFRLYLCCHFC